MMISIDLDLANKRKVTNIELIGTITFPSSYYAHLLKGLDYTSFVPFIRLKPTRMFFIYWQPITENSLTLDYLADLRARLVIKYYKGDLIRVKDYTISNLNGHEAHILTGNWENKNDRLKGIFELLALSHNDFLILFDISTTDYDFNGDTMKELRQIRKSLILS